MTKGQLTKQELGWLLTQEAQGAAERLRSGVKILRNSLVPAAPVDTPPSSENLDATLDALDDAMQMLSSLHTKPTGAAKRRGRIEVASLILEIAPDARVAMEPGSGTEVYGEEDDVRRMLQVLLGPRDAGLAVTVKRDGDNVRVTVKLGSEGAIMAETERAWLSRMAIRYGGRHELEGLMATLTLPADNVSEKKEREALQKELDEAKKQGAEYARELAAIFEQQAFDIDRPSSLPAVSSEGPSGRMRVLSRAIRGITSELQAALAPLSQELDDLRALHGDDANKLDSAKRRAHQLLDWVHTLSLTGTASGDELPKGISLRAIADRALEKVAFRASRGGVELKLEGPMHDVVVQERALEAAAVLLMTQAVGASPDGATVTVRVFAPEGVRGPRLSIEDEGPALPTTAFKDFVDLKVDPMIYGRSSAVSYYLADELVRSLGGVLEMSGAPAGGLIATIQLANR